jgi:hypothetical protein
MIGEASHGIENLEKWSKVSRYDSFRPHGAAQPSASNHALMKGRLKRPDDHIPAG